MHRSLLGLGGASALALAFALPVTAASAATGPTIADHAVFVQLDNPSGNAIQAYHRSSTGALSIAGLYATGGKGGTEVNAPVDALASQNSLVFSDDHRLLFAVNAGSNTVSVFRVTGDHLALRQIVPSGGSFPSSIAVHGDLVEVLNAGGAGAVKGFRIVADATLVPVAGSARSLGLSNAATPVFITAPAQVGFTPDGRHVVVTTKAHNTIDTFRVWPDGRLSPRPVITPSKAPVPFSFTFDAAGHLVVTEVGTSALTTYSVKLDGTVNAIDSVSTGQAATCWVNNVNGVFYTANTGSSTISRYTIDGAGVLSLHGIAAHTSGAPIDAAASWDGKFLYSQNAGAGTVDIFAVNADTTLTSLGSVTGLPAFAAGIGMEGIAAA